MDRTSTLPIFPLGTVLFPNGLMPLHVFEERYRRMLRDTSHHDPAFVIALSTSPSGDTAERLEPASIGTACRVSGVSPRPDGRSDIVVTGTSRVTIGELDWSNGYAVAEVSLLDDRIEDDATVRTEYSAIVTRFRRYLDALEVLIGDELPALDPTNRPERGAWVIGETLTLHTWERQRLLEQPTVDARLQTLRGYLRREYALLVHTGMIGNPIDFPGRHIALN